ncbi:MAG: hypothetical protein GWM90_31055, partial [Gemmatimonadetes bacterium]|nr:hypothetical protein [Gemmatimonadota bacterium]NIQ55635.1 hypothetical protein [Gemmatimonadota bacterium]NIU79852.1 hypothetical protein [Gammaproteobacteria bacterium]NIX48341.1 hypothetical protein [Gemmatimonadota bacterium]NIY12788.1 hypothetical protein [Gemmatimonadota bacterium]
VERLRARVRVDPELEAVAGGDAFRYVPPDMARETGMAPVAAYLDLLNERLAERIGAAGETRLAPGTREGRVTLSPDAPDAEVQGTAGADVDTLAGLVTRLGRQVDAELRSPLDERIIAGARTGTWSRARAAARPAASRRAERQQARAG